MKSIILKKMMPVAVFVLGISGAFLTTSMQSDAKLDEVAPVLGYIEMFGDPCAIPVACSDTVGEVCHLFNNEDLPQAFGEDSPTTCSKEVYRPQ
jgi:hypothetical protein